MVTMYGEDRDGDIVIGVFIVDDWEPDYTHTTHTTPYSKSIQIQWVRPCYGTLI